MVARKCSVIVTDDGPTIKQNWPTLGILGSHQSAYIFSKSAGIFIVCYITLSAILKYGTSHWAYDVETNMNDVDSMSQQRRVPSGVGRVPSGLPR